MGGDNKHLTPGDITGKIMMCVDIPGDGAGRLIFTDRPIYMKESAAAPSVSVYAAALFLLLGGLL